LFLESQSHLNFEMKKIKQAIKEKDHIAMKIFYNEYLKMTAIPKREVHKENSIVVCSSIYSFHLLSVYLLLDYIDFFWDGHTFFDRQITGDFSLLDELRVSERVNDFPFADLTKSLQKVSKILRDELYIFLIPYQFKKDYVVKMAYPGNVLLLYKNHNESINDFFFEGIGEFYLKKKFKSSLPYWAKNKEMFKKEFVSWCKGEQSLFRS